MIETIRDILQSIGHFFEIIFNAVSYLIESLMEVIELCADAIGFGSMAVTYLPVVYAVPFLAIITITIAFKIKG